MKAEHTRHLVYEAIEQIKDYNNHLRNQSIIDAHLNAFYREIDEFERLADIGRATEKAFCNNEYCIASYKGNHLNSIKIVDELLQWVETRCKGCCELKNGKCTRIGSSGEVGICWMERGEGEY